MNGVERRRRRPPVSCSLCRKRKLRCNRETPCSNCVHSRNRNCIYDNSSSQSPRRPPVLGQTTTLNLAPKPCSLPIDRDSSISRRFAESNNHLKSLVPNSTIASSPTSELSAPDVEFMKSRIKELEDQLSNRTQNSAQSSVLTSNKEAIVLDVAETSCVDKTSQYPATNRSVVHKTRLFGQSHWCNGVQLFRAIFEMLEPSLRDGSSKVFSGIQRSKYLAKLIKLQREPLWPSLPTDDLPPKDVADKLVNCYLRTTETVFRVLHIPTFKKDYEALWASETKPNTAFLTQVKLVLAIGSATYDEQFSLRDLAIRWVYDAHIWSTEPEFKSRLNLQSLQNSLLLLLARETTAVAEESNWISIGALLRTAVYMGLHRDPSSLPTKTIFFAEMRRRVWNTILELALQSSINSGGPPLISLADFNTEAPGNFDDEQLLDENSTAKLEDDFTQSSIAIALRKTFPIRLEITKFLNDLASCGTYEETIRLDAELRVSYQTLCGTLQKFNSSTGRSPSQFEKSVVDFIMRRFALALHIPFFGRALHETTLDFSRKVVIKTSLQTWCAVYPSSSIAAQFSSDVTLPGESDFARLAMCGLGFFRTVAIQACFLIAVELKTQLYEEESLGPVPLRPDLLAVLDEAKTWSWQCMEAGETNIKCYLYMCLAGVMIQGLMRGLPKDKFPEVLVAAAEETEARCLEILEEKAGQGRTTGNGPSVITPQPDAMAEDWDFLVSDNQFDFGMAEPTSWAFSNGATQELFLW